MNYFKNWKCYSYGLKADKTNKEYSYSDLKDIFEIKGLPVCKCKKDFLSYERGKFYFISDGRMYGYGFIISDHAMKSYIDWID